MFQTVKTFDKTTYYNFLTHRNTVFDAYVKVYTLIKIQNEGLLIICDLQTIHFHKLYKHLIAKNNAVS